MFADAYDEVKDFTFPVVISTRTWDNTVQSSLAAFVVLNEEGWFATAAHVLSSYFAWQRHQEGIAHYRQAVEAKRPGGRKKRSEKRAKANPKWITNQSFRWVWDGVRLAEVHVRERSDLAVGRLEPFEPGLVKRYPVLKNPEALRPGTSLCRLGYPFHELQSTWDPESGNFTLAAGSLPAPLFPIEGIFTRQVRAEGSPRPVFIETSSPGLRGQSGGPVFDTAGQVWSIQSRTRHFNLGFAPEVHRGGRSVQEHQFLNVGLAVHPAELISLLDEKDINYRQG